MAELKETLHVDVDIPDHAPRTETALFERTRRKLLAETPHCWICGRTAEEAGQPLEAHHLEIERCYAETKGLLWDLVAKDNPGFDWSKWTNDPYAFVDDMEANGVMLCKLHHTGEFGIHTIPYPIWRIQRYMPDGYQFAPDEVVHRGHTEGETK